jgi:hypothetical protein
MPAPPLDPTPEPPLDPLTPEPPRRDPDPLEELAALDAEGELDRAAIRAFLSTLFSVGGVTRPTAGSVEVPPP